MADVKQLNISERVQLVEKDAEIAALRNRNLVLAQLLDNAEQANGDLTQKLYAAQAELAQIAAGNEPEGPKGDDIERPSLPN